MQRLDQLNARFGRTTVQVAAALPSQPKAPGSKSKPVAPWQGQQQHRTFAFTTSWEELWEIG